MTDSLASARRIRSGDLADALDPAPEEKGAAVLAMFEQFLGRPRFQETVQRYLRAHVQDTATSADFLAALAETRKDDTVTAALASFLDQAGVPDLDLDWSCEGGGVAIRAAYTRYVPLGVTPS